MRVRAIAGCLLLTSCATYQPEPLVPSDELTRLSGVTIEGVTVQHARPGDGDESPQRLLDVTDGLNESELASIALSLNPGLKAKRLEAGLAEALVLSAGLLPNPKIGVGWRPGLGNSSGYTADAALLVELLAPGERDARVDAATARSATVHAEVLATEWRVVSETRLSWLAVLSAEQGIDLLTEEVRLREQAVAHLRSRRELGEGTELDVVAAELELAQIQRDLRLATADLATSRRSLNAMLGLPPDHRLELTGSGKPLAITVFEDLSDEELDQRLLSGRLELRALEASYEEAEHELRLAVAKQFPRIDIGPSFDHENDGGDYLGLGVGIAIPLFDRNQGEIAERESQRRQRRAEYVTLLHSLRATAYERRATLRRAKAELDVQARDLLPTLSRLRALFESAFTARDINVFEWLSVRERALTAQRGYLDAIVRYRRQVIEFESATGLPLSRPLAERK